MKDLPMPIYISEDGSIKTDIQIKDETIRLNNRKKMSKPPWSAMEIKNGLK